MTNQEIKDEHKFVWSELILIGVVIILILIGVLSSGAFHPRETKSDRIEMSVRAQSINLIYADRLHHTNLSRLPVKPYAQSLANKKALQVYKILNSQPHYSSYSIHNLDSNSNSGQQDALSHRLNHKAKSEYGINCAEISFGKRHFKNNQHRWQPYHYVKTPWGISGLVNSHFMRYDQANHDVHHNNIVDKHAVSMGVSALYNRKNNRGVLVEVIQHH